MLKYNHTFCHASHADGCRECYDTIMGNNTKREAPTIRHWRDKWAQFFMHVDRFIVFSEFTRSVFTKIYPDIAARIEIGEVPLDFLRPVTVPAPSDRVHIGVIGALGYHKGHDVVRDMAQAFVQDPQRRVIVSVFGPIGEGVDGATWHGEYQRDALPELMERHQVDIIFIPSICGETYSQTAQEARLMGMPLAVFDIGALTERVAGYDNGVIISRMDPMVALDEIEKFVREMLWKR